MPPSFVAAQDEDELFARGLEEVLQQVEKEMILHALAKADNSKMRAADLLKTQLPQPALQDEKARHRLRPS